MRGFVWRRQQIGQLEILAGLVPYLSPAMQCHIAGREVIHWIDNTSAKAALVYGYSGVPESAPLVHAFHALNLVVRSKPWFEWIPTKANPSDEPSRVDYSSGPLELADGIVSQPVPVSLPPMEAWGNVAGWARLAAAWGRGARR